MFVLKSLKKNIIPLIVCVLFLSAFSHAHGTSAVPDDAVVIGFIDSGVALYNLDPTHVLEGKNYVFENGDTIDRIGHGTKTAGTVLGSSDGSVTGIFPDAYVVPLVVVDKYPSGVTSNGGTTALISAIYDAVDVFDCDIINISLSTTEDSTELRSAIDYATGKNTIIVCSSGNTPDSEEIFYPAHYENVITVGASDGLSPASFSTVRDADFFYEGKNVRVVNYKQGKAYTVDSGTSFSCASVSGICANWLSQDPDLTQDEIRSMLAEHCASGCDDILISFTAEDYALEVDSSGEISAEDYFTDVAENDWFREAAIFCKEHRFFEGYADGTFRGTVKMTMKELAAVLYNVADADEKQVSGPWYATQREWMEKNGIVESFDADATVTREDFIVMFVKTIALKGIDTTVTEEMKAIVSAATDYADISAANADYIAWAVDAGLIAGTSTAALTVTPQKEMNRATVAAMLMNYNK